MWQAGTFQDCIMRPLRWFRISLPKFKRIFCILFLFLALYVVCLVVFQALNGISRINGANWLHHLNHRNNTVFLTFERTVRPGNSSINGFFNVHTWTFACKLTLEKLVEHPLFPISPNAQTFVDNLDLKWNEKSSKDVKEFGRRILGFIKAPYTGHYRFSMLTSSNAELWLSTDEKVENIKLLCKSVDYNSSLTKFQKEGYDVPTLEQSSKLCISQVLLRENQFYYLEIIQTNIIKQMFHLTWKMPHSNTFEELSKKYLYSFMEKSLEFEEFIKQVPLTKSTSSLITSNPKLSILSNTKSFLSGKKYLEWSDVKLALPTCPYHPGYIGKRVLYTYHAVEKFVNPSYVYPAVNHAKLKDGKWIPWFPLSKTEALDVARKYMQYLEEAYSGKYKFKRLLNAEKKPDWNKNSPVFYKGTSKYGDRFLLEILLLDNRDNKDVILSEYIYKEEKSKKLCYPESMQWNKTAPIYLLVSVRKQAKWVWHFIKNVERIYQSMTDENLHVIVYDYNSTDIDIEEEFRKSSFNNYKILKNPDSKYSRTYSLNRAAEAVKDNDAIVFTLDLHLEIPPSFPNNIRKHCIQGKMVFTPIITRLSCGASPRFPSGSWDPWGYGMFGAYKTDWDKFKGFDEVKFKTKWGGEDWDLVDRAYNVGLEFDRIKQTDFYHYYHSTVGMWT